MRLATDPDGFAQELAHPHATPPTARRAPRNTLPRLAGVPLRRAAAADAGTGELPGSDAEIAQDERDLGELETASNALLAHRTPTASRRQLAIAGRVVRGRIDAVYRAQDDAGTT